MKALNLVLHAGGRVATREQILNTTTPEATDTHVPIPHGRLIELVETTLARAGYSVIAQAHALARGHDHYFGLLQLANGTNSDDYALVAGLRNAHDKVFNAGFLAGSGVFVCDNLAFSGEVKIGRKHTRYIERDLPRLVEVAVGKLGGLRVSQDERIKAYQETPITDAEAHDIVIQSLDVRVIGSRLIPTVVEEYRKPRHEAFKPRNVWSLFNAYTEVLKKCSVFDRPRSTQALHGLLDTRCKLLAPPTPVLPEGTEGTVEVLN